MELLLYYTTTLERVLFLSDYQTPESSFTKIGCASFYNPTFAIGVWKSDETHFLVFDILLLKPIIIHEGK